MSEIDLTQFEGHTPGPWESEFRAGVYSEGVIATKDLSVVHGGIAIVEGQNWGAWRNSDDNGDAEFAANARLIAAAPDLLAAYKAALARAEAAEQNEQEWKSRAFYELGRAEAAERQRDEAFHAGAEAMREAIYNYVYDEAEAMKEQAYNLIEHHSFRPGGRGVSNEAKRKGFIRDRQQIAEKLFIDAAHIRTLPIPAQEVK